MEEKTIVFATNNNNNFIFSQLKQLLLEVVADWIILTDRPKGLRLSAA